VEKLPKVLYHGTGMDGEIINPHYRIEDQLYVAASADRDLALLKGFKQALEQRYRVISLTHKNNLLMVVLSAHSALLPRVDLKQTMVWLHTISFSQTEWERHLDVHPSCWFSLNKQSNFVSTEHLQLSAVYKNHRYVIIHVQQGEVEGVFT